MFGFIKRKISNFFSGLGNRLKELFSTTNGAESIDFLKLEKLLLESDVGMSVSEQLINSVKKICRDQNYVDFQAVSQELKKQLLEILSDCQKTEIYPKILLLVGVNGVGKTTFAAKFAHHLKSKGKKPLLVAADTFRAAAVDQISVLAGRANIDLVEGIDGQDPASVVFQGASKYIDGGFDHLIIDTAGRLHTKVNLMAELEKIGKVLEKKLGNDASQISTWLVMDSMLGQSSISQAEIFNESTKLNGIVLTKCDGTAKGGGVFAIAKKFKLPVAFLTAGQSFDDLEAFDAQDYVDKFLT